MRRVYLCLAGLLMAFSAYGQAPAGNSTTATPAPASPLRPPQRLPMRPHSASKGARFKPEISVSTPVVTLEGVCAQTAKNAKQNLPCKTVVTRGQLDAVLDAINPNAQPKTRQQFAISYARLLVAGQIAEEQHLDQNPEVLRAVQAEQKIARMQVLTEALLEKVQKEAERVPQKDLEAYYKQYSTSFEQAEIRRLAVPLNATTESGKPLDAAVVKAKMEELRDLSLKGESFEDLQSSAYKELGIKGDTPLTRMMVNHRGELGPEENSLFEMELGGTTPVFESQGAVFVLKLISRKMQTLNDVREQIQAILLQQRMQEGLREASKGISAEFNLKYIDSKTQPDLFGPSVMGLGMRRGMLSSMHVQP